MGADGLKSRVRGELLGDLAPRLAPTVRCWLLGLGIPIGGLKERKDDWMTLGWFFGGTAMKGVLGGLFFLVF